MDINNILVVTIAIQMHGTVITYELSSETANIFENVRLLCKAGGFRDYESSGLEEFILVKNLRDYFARDIERPTYDIIKEAKKGIFVGNITFDKTLSIKGGGALDYVWTQGIYLLSIHRGKRLIYPEDENDKIINFLKVDDLNRLASMFDSRVPNLEDISIPFPDQQMYIDEENMVKQHLEWSEDEKQRKIKEIRMQFYDMLNKWDLTLKTETYIEIIKLSYLVKLVKILINENCIINLLDYSCNSATSYIPESQKLSAKYMIEPDIEQGTAGTNYGGKIVRSRKRKNVKSRKRKNVRSRKRQTKTIKRKI